MIIFNKIQNQVKMADDNPAPPGNTENKPEYLERLIAYQKDSVVSKTIIKKPTGTITLFAFDKDQGLSEHSAPYDALVFIVDGEATITIGGQPYRVKKNEMMILPANIPHALQADHPFKMLLTMIKS